MDKTERAAQKCVVQKCTVQANAKINLFLDVTGRREDGYHTITGVMQAIDLSDTVTVEVQSPAAAGVGEISLACSDPALPTDRGNLAWRAAEAFFAATGKGCGGLRITIEKRIPAAAGLAGGSTDAAAVLSALNALYGAPLSLGELCAVGVRLGADVPFCIKGNTHMTEGVGEVLTPLSPLPFCEILLSCAGEGVSTPWAYRALDERYGGFAAGAYAPRLAALQAQIRALEAGDLGGVCAAAWNIFESVVSEERPVVSDIKRILHESGATLAMMSGSGPSVFGLFSLDSPAVHVAEQALLQAGYPVWHCRPVR